MKVLLQEAIEFYDTKNPNQRMTKSRLAQLVGVSRKTISAIESGKSKPSVELAIRIARALKVRRVEAIFQLPL